MERTRREGGRKDLRFQDVSFLVRLVLHYKPWIDSETVIMAEREADKMKGN